MYKTNESTKICRIIIMHSNKKHDNNGCKAVKPASLTEETLGPQNVLINTFIYGLLQQSEWHLFLLIFGEYLGLTINCTPILYNAKLWANNHL